MTSLQSFQEQLIDLTFFTKIKSIDTYDFLYVNVGTIILPAPCASLKSNAIRSSRVTKLAILYDGIISFNSTWSNQSSIGTIYVRDEYLSSYSGNFKGLSEFTR
jgi:hypothetical protein